MDHRLGQELAKVPDLRHQVRRLKHFRGTFRRALACASQESGVTFEIDETRLVEAFFRWLEAFAEQKAAARINRRDFAHFAAALMLREFFRASPVAAVRPAEPLEAASVAAFWPEGYLGTSFCMSVLDGVLEQEFGEALTIAPAASDLRTWWSFRENVAEDPNLAIGFFDCFTGNEPNWTLPGYAAARPAMRVATLAAH